MSSPDTAPATKADVKEIVSAALGEFAVMVKHGFDHLENRVDKLENRVGQLELRVDKLENRVGQLELRMDKLETRMDKLETRMENMETSINTKIDELKRHFDVVAETIHVDVAGANRDEVLFIKQKTENHETRLSAVEQRVGL